MHFTKTSGKVTVSIQDGETLDIRLYGGNAIEISKKELIDFLASDSPLIASYLKKENERLQSLVDDCFDRIEQMRKLAT